MLKYASVVVMRDCDNDLLANKSKISKLVQTLIQDSLKFLEEVPWLFLLIHSNNIPNKSQLLEPHQQFFGIVPKK